VSNFRPFGNSGANTPTSLFNSHTSSSHHHGNNNNNNDGNTGIKTMTPSHERFNATTLSNATSRYYRHLSNYVSGDLTTNMTASKIAPYVSEKTTHAMKSNGSGQGFSNGSGSSSGGSSQYETNSYQKSNTQTASNSLTPPVYSNFNKQHSGGFELTTLQPPHMTPAALLPSTTYSSKFSKNREAVTLSNSESLAASNANKGTYESKRYSGTSSTGTVKSYGGNSDMINVGSTMITNQILSGAGYSSVNGVSQYPRSINGYNASNRAGSTSSNSNYDENEFMNGNEIINGE
jgi:hypothetical protein